MRSFQLFDSRSLFFIGAVFALQFGGRSIWDRSGEGEFPGYWVALCLAVGALLAWAAGHGVTPNPEDFKRRPSAAMVVLRGKAAFDDGRKGHLWHPTAGQASWLHALSAGLGVAAVASFVWAAAHDPERLDPFLAAVGPLGLALALGLVLLATLLWAGWDLLFPAPPPEDEPPPV